MISGAHIIVSSTHAEADREFFRDVLGLPHVDAGDGWLIFGLPPSEVAVHPADSDGSHELYLMSDDLEAFLGAVEARGLATTPVDDQGWGLVTHVTLPGGGQLGVYQPRHARPDSPGAREVASEAPPRAKRPDKRPKKKKTAANANARARKAPAATAKRAAKKQAPPKKKKKKAAPAKKKRR